MRWRRIGHVLLFACVFGVFGAERYASLQVSWSAAAPAIGQKLSLVPVDVTLPDGLSRAEAIRGWTKDAEARQRWDSLPPGTYRIVLRGESVPIELGEVVLAPGEERSLVLTLPAEAPRSVSTQTLSVSLQAYPKDSIVTLWHDVKQSLLQPAVTRAHGDRVLLEFPAACHDSALIVLESAESIGSVRLDGNCDSPIRVAVAPKATLLARLTAPRGTTLPGTGVARFTQCELDIPFATTSAAIRTPIAAGCGDPTFHLRGFAPATIRAKPWSAGETRDLGAITLREGATAVVQVRSGRRGEPKHNVRLSVLRANDLASMERDTEIDRAIIASAVSDATGWARLEGLPEEPIVFRLQSADRRTPQFSEPYALAAGEEMVIDDLVFGMPSSVFVGVTMKRGLEKSLQLHSVQLRATDHTHWPSRISIDAERTDFGYVAHDVPPGTWQVAAVCRVNNGFYVAAAEETIEVASAPMSTYRSTSRHQSIQGVSRTTMRRSSA
jgi:hypothetical protein